MINNNQQEYPANINQQHETGCDKGKPSTWEEHVLYFIKENKASDFEIARRFYEKVTKITKLRQSLGLPDPLSRHDLSKVPQSFARYSRLSLFPKAVKFLEDRDYECYLGLFDSEFLLEPFMDLIPRLSPEEYWTLFRSVWSRNELVHPYTREWKNLLEMHKAHRAEGWMTNGERKLLQNLPNKVTIYRGFHGYHENGLSWTLNKAIAERFAGRMRWRVGSGCVATATCLKKNIIAYVNERQEEEIVIFPRHVHEKVWSPYPGKDHGTASLCE